MRNKKWNKYEKTFKTKFEEKPLFLVGDLNINSLDYSRNTHVFDFFNFDFKIVYFL